VSATNWFETTFTLSELLSLSEDELSQLEELRGDISLKAAWWRQRREKVERDG
jgi:hypothetical protein